MFFRQLSEYKTCKWILNCSAGGPYNLFHCMIGYKFHITMEEEENTLIDGYISEKVFNGALAGGFPIYFGASDIAKYVNSWAIVHCDVSKEVIKEMRSFYPRTKRPQYFYFDNRSNESTWPTDEELFVWADSYLCPQLDPCVKRVVELDTNDTAFREVINKPFINNQDILSGEYPLRGVQLAHNVLRNWNINNNDATFKSKLN